MKTFPAARGFRASSISQSPRLRPPFWRAVVAWFPFAHRLHLVLYPLRLGSRPPLGLAAHASPQKELRLPKGTSTFSRFAPRLMASVTTLRTMPAAQEVGPGLAAGPQI
jgi:hypothetical protein